MPEPGRTPRVTAVVVTYRPEVAETAALLHALRPQVDHVIVVDNASGEQVVAALRDVLEGADLVELDTNRGIAAAQNLGIARARTHGADFVLLSDQDSAPAPDMIARLIDGFQRAQDTHPRVAAVGPVTVDDRAPEATLLFAARFWGPRRAEVPTVDGALVPVAFLLASGCLIDAAALDAVGPMNEAWFIDHIDLEWGLRATRAGYSLFGVAGASLGHRLGDRTVDLPGRERAVHIHSPVRNYYMARNTVLLIRSGLMPWRWRFGYAAWITKYAGFYVLLVRPRGVRTRLMARGLADGLRRRTGPLAAAGAPRR